MKKVAKIFIALGLVVAVGFGGFTFWSKNTDLNDEQFTSLAEDMRIESQNEIGVEAYSISVISDYNAKSVTVDFVSNKTKDKTKVDKESFKKLHNKLAKKHNKVKVNILVFDKNTNQLLEVK